MLSIEDSSVGDDRIDHFWLRPGTCFPSVETEEPRQDARGSEY